MKIKKEEENKEERGKWVLKRYKQREREKGREGPIKSYLEIIEYLATIWLLT